MKKNWHIFLALSVIAIVMLYILFSPKLYGTHSDYIFFVPHLVSNKIYFLKNGWFALPYYTPAFHGGYSQYADMQDMTVSLIQFFVNLVPNVYVALNLSFIAHLVLSVIGMAFFLRKFRFHRWTATMGGLLYGLNGFIVARWTVGHLIFQTMWTVPWILGHAHVLAFRQSFKELMGPALWIALLLSLNIYSSGLYTIFIIFILTGTFFLASAIMQRNIPWKGLVSFTGAVGLSQILSLSKIIAVTSILRQFPRHMEIEQLGWERILSIIPKSLFDPGAGIASRPYEDMGQWHEFSAYVGVSLLISLLVGFASSRRLKPSNRVRTVFLWAVLTVVCTAILMTGSDRIWSFFKDVPIIKSNHAPYRAIGALPIIFISLVAASWNQMAGSGRKIPWLGGILSVVCLLDVMAFHATQNLSPIYQVPLDYPRSLKTVEISRWQERNIYGGVRAPNPTFDWDLKYLTPPVDIDLPPLHRYPDGTYNINDPMAMVYSKEVGKRPWSRLDGSVTPEQAELFLAFENPAFYVSPQQRIANKVSAATWLVLVPAAILLSL